MSKSQQIVESSIRIRAPLEKVSSLLEDISRTPEWNPLVTHVRPAKGKGRGLHSTLEWKANLAGIKITGLSEARSWKFGKEYSWKNTEKLTGLSLEGTILLRKVEGETDLAAVVSYSLPKSVALIVNKVGVNQLLKSAVEKALRNINTIVSADIKQHK